MASKKLKLDLDKLSVESFDSQGPESVERGTVLGRDFITVDYTCYDATCRGYGTCGIYPCKQVP